jgi:predicted dehydrogenase
MGIGMGTQVSIAVVGAGGRGFGFAEIISKVPQWARVTAVAEPREDYREAFARRYAIPAENVLKDWRELAARPRLSDAVLVCTQDRDHVEPAVAFTRLGYHMLLEKPMATSMEDCRRIARAQE